MKTTNLILILMAVLGLMSCHQLHYVTLYVDTTNFNPNDIETHASFGQRANIPNEHFVTNVRRGDKVIWNGISTTDTTHTVSISEIEHESGDHILSKGGVIPGASISPIPLVFGKTKIVAKPARGMSYLQEKYSIKFELSNTPGTFTIDPKIRSHGSH
ncbi:MAG: hypothetical protein ACR2MM_07075 [Flavobacteriaceae bacterium]